MNLAAITDEMFEFIEKETRVKKNDVLTVEENEELRQKLLGVLIEIEADEVISAGDNPLSQRGILATEIGDLLCYPCPMLDDENDDDEDN